MVVIYDINSEYNENELSLGNPGKIHGSSGSYYTKIFLNKELFYFKLQNCTTKDGILQTEKKIYTDILFSLLNNDLQYVEWFHKLELVLINLIYSKSSSWFFSELDKEDISEYFNPITRQYKTNNSLLRVHLNNNKKIPECIIFDENEEIKTYDDVYGKKFDCIIHIKGIRFTSTSFQIDLELKQILLLEDMNVFSSCILRNNSKKQENCENPEGQHSDQIQTHEFQMYVECDGNEHLLLNKENKKLSTQVLLLSNGEDYIEKNQELEDKDNDNDNENDNENENNFELSDGEVHENIKEYNLDCNMENKSSVQIREPKDVYKELYEKMLQKAVSAKQEYLNAYKHAQFIKNEYLGIYENENENENNENENDHINFKMKNYEI